MLLQLQLIMWVFVAGRALEIQKEGACMWHALCLLRNNSSGVNLTEFEQSFRMATEQDSE